MIRPGINCVAMTYALTQDPRYADLMTVKSSLTGRTVNRFTHLHQSTEAVGDMGHALRNSDGVGPFTAG